MEKYVVGSVPVAVAARVYGKDASWVRAGLINGWLPIGNATCDGQLVTSLENNSVRTRRINYYISPKLMYEHTGYQWKGGKTWAQEEIL